MRLGVAAPDAPRQTSFNHPSELWEKELHLNYVVLRELTFAVLPSMQKRDLVVS